MKQGKIKTLLLDIGGVLLTDGWNRDSRSRAIKHFKLEKDQADINERHSLHFDTYELDRTTFDEYLDNTIFYKKRDFKKKDFIQFMYGESKPLPGAIDYFKDLKKKNGLRVFACSNEARELNAYRIETFKLDELFDGFVSSCYVNMRKPDPRMYKMAAEIATTEFKHVVYVDDRGIYIEYALTLGLPSLHYTGIDSAKKYFKKAGLK